MGHYFIFFYRRNDLFTPATLNPAPQFSFESSRARLHFTSSYCIFYRQRSLEEIYQFSWLDNVA